MNNRPQREYRAENDRGMIEGHTANSHLIVTTAKNVAPVSDTFNLNTGSHIFNHWEEEEEEISD